MSIIYKDQIPTGWGISHPKYFSNLKIQENIYKLNPNLFKIQSEFTANSNKRKQKAQDVSLTAKLVENLSKTLLKPDLFSTNLPESITDNQEAIDTARLFFDDNCTYEFVDFHGENSNPYGIFSKIKGMDNNEFLFPPNSKFHCGDVKDFDFSGELIDLVVLDPPWRNRFIRRRKRTLTQAGYQQLESFEISNIPIERILEDEGLIVVWCTNSKLHQDKVLNEIFPKWNVNLIATWYWLKVTTQGIPICPYTKEGGKQPYETILIGRKTRNIIKEPTRLIISIPSAINSHKPPLIDVLESHFSTKFKSKCELFARYLLPGFTSYGNQVVKLMHRDLFVKDMKADFKTDENKLEALEK